jgi:hypothetical protein
MRCRCLLASTPLPLGGASLVGCCNNLAVVPAAGMRMLLQVLRGWHVSQLGSLQLVYSVCMASSGMCLQVLQDEGPLPPCLHTAASNWCNSCWLL